MKILSAYAKKVHGFLDIYVEFNEDLTFVVGPNGSGKTTILYLMQLALSFSIEKLFLIKFSELAIKVMDDSNKTRIILFKCLEDSIEISLSKSINISFSTKFIQRDPYMLSMIKKDLLREPKYLKAAKFFEDIKKPCFLNIERIESNLDPEEDRFFDPAYRRRMELNQRQKLEIVSDLIATSYKEIADQRDIIQKKLYVDTFMSLFTHNSKISFRDMFHEPEIDKLTSIKNEVKQLISKTFTEKDQKRYDQKINKFFDDFPSEFDDNQTGNEPDALIKNLSYSFQIDRIFALNDTYRDYNSKLDIINEPIRIFESVLNEFYQDCDIVVSVDALGRVVIERPGGFVSTINELSSGETQLLIIFTHLIFSAKKENKIFIIDEPELSLHLKWQEILTEKIMSFNPTSQVILATHSPDIIGGYYHKAWNIKSHE